MWGTIIGLLRGILGVWNIAHMEFLDDAMIMGAKGRRHQARSSRVHPSGMLNVISWVQGLGLTEAKRGFLQPEM